MTMTMNNLERNAALLGLRGAQKRRCGNCAHAARSGNDAEILCKGAPPSSQIVGLRPPLIEGGEPIPMTAIVWPAIKKTEVCGCHEFPEELEARRNRLIRYLAADRPIAGPVDAPLDPPAEEPGDAAASDGRETAA